MGDLQQQQRPVASALNAPEPHIQRIFPPTATACLRLRRGARGGWPAHENGAGRASGGCRPARLATASRDARSVDAERVRVVAADRRRHAAPWGACVSLQTRPCSFADAGRAPSPRRRPAPPPARTRRRRTAAPGPGRRRRPAAPTGASGFGGLPASASAAKDRCGAAPPQASRARARRRGVGAADVDGGAP